MLAKVMNLAAHGDLAPGFRQKVLPWQPWPLAAGQAQMGACRDGLGIQGRCTVLPMQHELRVHSLTEQSDTLKMQQISLLIST
ncbi:hypothetical protein PC116_g12871 [Phytophthora cactorum]|nr:hypothetical protein PC116_g12871 [Phytophthora cactorum]